MVRADFPTPEQWIAERMSRSEWRMLTTTTDDNKLVLSQELCLASESALRRDDEWSGILWTWRLVRKENGQ